MFPPLSRRLGQSASLTLAEDPEVNPRVQTDKRRRHRAVCAKRAPHLAPFRTGLSALTETFDPALTSSTGNLWGGGVFNFLYLPPGQSGTIELRHLPYGRSWDSVSGTQYVDDWNCTGLTDIHIVTGRARKDVPVWRRWRKRPRPRRSFTPEFKADIVERCLVGDRSVNQVAEDFDLTETAIREWVRQAEMMPALGRYRHRTEGHDAREVRLRVPDRTLSFSRQPPSSTSLGCSVDLVTRRLSALWTVETLTSKL